MMVMEDNPVFASGSGDAESNGGATVSRNTFHRIAKLLLWVSAFGMIALVLAIMAIVMSRHIENNVMGKIADIWAEDLEKMAVKNLRIALARTADTRVGFRVRKNGIQPIGIQTSVIAPWLVDASILGYNIGGLDLVTGVYTVPAASGGLYLISWNVGWLNPPNVGTGRTDLYVNDVIVNTMHTWSEVGGQPGLSSSQWGSTLVPLAGGDAVTLRASRAIGDVWTIDGSVFPFDPVTTWTMEFIRT